MRRPSLAGRISFGLAARLRLRTLPPRAGRGVLSVTFDDIPRSAWTTGGRILAQHDARATYYLSGDLCGRVFEGREQYRREDVKAMIAEGHEIGSHLFRHLSTLSLNAAQLRLEIARNDQFLQEVTESALRPQSFAYPYGEISIAAKWLCNHRFASSRSVMAGLNSTGTDSDQLRILPIDNAFADPAAFADILQTAARNSAWVIALAHGVDDTGHPFSCPPDRLEALLSQAKAAGLDLLTVGEVMKRA